MAVAVVVLGGADALPAEAFVEPDGGGVFGHDVEDESQPVLVCVVGGGARELLPELVAACLRVDEQPAEYRDVVPRASVRLFQMVAAASSGWGW